VKELERVRYFKDPEPVREISLVTHRNFLKKKLIRTLEEVILENIPSKMKSVKQKNIISTSM
jgi:LysR family hydrogen peroxide-inducible transcriptional activator